MYLNLSMVGATRPKSIRDLIHAKINITYFWVLLAWL